VTIAGIYSQNVGREIIENNYAAELQDIMGTMKPIKD
jgi:hypothetical protein